jgi:hypothetical protein
MPFNFVKVSKDDILSINTRKIYRVLLNKLAKEGYDTQDKLIDNSKEIIEYINNTYDNNYKKRVMLSAIFYILCDTEYYKTPNELYNYFQTLKTPD